MSALVTAIHIITCFILIIAVLLQSGKSADLAGAFGGVGSQTVFGPRGVGTILSKATTICAILFMFTSMGLWILSAKGTKSVVKGEGPAKEEAAVTETQKKTEPQKAPATEQKQEKQEKSSETEKKTEKKEGN